MKLASARPTVLCRLFDSAVTSSSSVVSGLRMILRLLFNLLNNHRVVEKLAESRPIRRAAQITAYAITKAQIAGKDASGRVLRSQTLRQVREEAGRVPGDLGEMSGRLRRVRQAFMEEGSRLQELPFIYSLFTSVFDTKPHTDSSASGVPTALVFVPFPSTSPPDREPSSIRTADISLPSTLRCYLWLM
ncbi:hypothetical protein L3Q82_007892 [Scortum barcoo]|uniref:Uncharacterized protein n=1 Tax=Scortum barcoo TaxID=214431 RepID=A0ACB8WJM5_9TELE|nr:hypothetical protein L3Q82_007892 [Scortum barcoo]